MDELESGQIVPEGYESVDAFLEEMRKRFQAGVDADRENRDAGMDDLRFLSGEGQWDEGIRAARLAKGRPCLTINTLLSCRLSLIWDASHRGGSGGG